MRIAILLNVLSMAVLSTYGQGTNLSGTPQVQQSACISYCDTMPLYRTSSTGEVEVMNGVYEGVAQQYDNLAPQILEGVHFRARVNPASGFTSNNLKVTVFYVTQGLPGSIIYTRNVMVAASNFFSDYYVYFTGQFMISGSIIVSVEPLSPSTDDYFIERNTPPDGQNLNLIKVKQASQWFKNLAVGDPSFDYDFMILPLTVSNVQASFTSSTANGIVSFQNTSTNATNFIWDFGDGNMGYSASPQHTYTTSGTYMVTLYAQGYGISGCVDSTQSSIVVTISGIESVDEQSLIRIKNTTVKEVLQLEAGRTMKVTIYSSNGKNCGDYELQPGLNSIRLDGWQAGVYLLQGEFRSQRFLIIN